MSVCALLALVVLQFPALNSQVRKMVIEGNIQIENGSVPASALIRILRPDSSIAATAVPYSLNFRQFGIRISTLQGFVENDRIHFRVVLSKRDSFVARTLGPGLVFRGTDPSEVPPVISVNLFRNHPPTFRRLIPDTIIDEGQPFRYRLIASDLDADTVRFGISQGPEASDIDPITGLFEWTPTYDDAGQYRIVVDARDGFERTISRPMRIRVRNVNRPPAFVAVARDTTIHEGQTLRLAYSARDPDEDTLSYTLRDSGNRVQLSSSTGIFDWTPTFDQSGVYDFRAVASDGDLADTSAVTVVTVLNVNRPPVFISAVRETSIAENQEIRLQYEADDPDGDSTSFSLRFGPVGMTLSPEGTLRWKPTFLQAGRYVIVVAVHDSELTSEYQTTIGV
ncbi:MAG TPA: putative Ig domain-containing protein, partial [Bacteroidota bacterium]|nr:putative Ig domain-containing protein [Bacteroidota bacterium]